MGVGGHFWDLLKPYARTEDFDFLRDKKVAVDLSFWTVQHETAIKKRGIARNPHLRIAFFRTINLFSKLGAFPVFVLDGVPSRLKAQARIARFLQATGIDLSGLPVAEEGVPIERNRAFTRCIQECVELLELLGMPILRARCEAEALCAQLNSEGHVDACITADSDAFLYGAKCVIKCLRSNSKEPFECYHMSEIEAGLGLKRKQLVAISLLVGNDHDLQGVPGIGVDTALRFVQLFPEDEILNRLCEVGKGDVLLLRGSPKAVVDCNIATGDESAKTRSPHCSHCGHPGNKRAHLKDACMHCNVYGYEKCTQKPAGFKCECFICDKDRRSKQLKRHENWQIKICKKIAAEQNFPNDEIIEMYLSENHWSFSENDGLPLFWGSPRIEALVDFLAYHQHWEPSYIRQRMLPMLSTIFLRDMASKPKDGLLLCDQYEFHSIQRVKIRYGHQFYLVKWKRAIPSIGNVTYTIPNEESDSHQSEPLGVMEAADVLDEPDVPEILVDDGCWFLLTDENMELVRAAFPKEVDRFLLEKELKESKSKGKKSKNKAGNGDRSGSPKSSGIQLSITEFYRSAKVLVQATNEEDPTKNSENSGEAPVRESKKRVTRSSSNLPKSVRKRLLFH